MTTLRTIVNVIWLVFWVYWLGSAFGVKEGRGTGRRFPVFGVTVVALLLTVRLFRHGSLAITSPVLGAIGAAIFASGLALAVWARIHLGQNWGMPMTQKAEPELVTSGPYRFVRHPIYTGLIAGMLGTGLVNNVIGVLFAALLGTFFYYSATVEERNLTATFPSAYPEYKAHTKMLIPFVI